MNKRAQQRVSRPFKLAMSLCGVAALGLFFFSEHVSSLSDDPLGTTPLSWGFKLQAAQVGKFFKPEATVNDPTERNRALPAIDAGIPERAASALFALG